MNLQNLVEWGDINGIDIFSGVSVPAPLNADTVKSAIMVRSGLMTPMYKEPEVFQALVTHWFTSKQWTIQHLINIIEAEYSPIENYNRIEESNTALSGSDVLTMAGGNQETHTGQDSETHSGTDTTTNSISAENSSSWSNDTKSDELHGHTITDSHGHTITDTYQNRADTTKYGKIDNRKSNIHGNIGVTTNQQMIEQELELLRHFDIYGYIADLFENDNMLLIY